MIFVYTIWTCYNPPWTMVNATLNMVKVPNSLGQSLLLTCYLYPVSIISYPGHGQSLRGDHTTYTCSNGLPWIYVHKTWECCPATHAPLPGRLTLYNIPVDLCQCPSGTQ
jgi:hypothetical protein